MWTNHTICVTDYIICSKIGQHLLTNISWAWLCVANVFKIPRRMHSGFFATTTLGLCECLLAAITSNVQADQLFTSALNSSVHDRHVGTACHNNTVSVQSTFTEI